MVKKVFLSSFLAILSCWIIFQVVYAAITLLYFRAIVSENAIRLEWKTATEFNNAGFNVQKSSNEFIQYSNLNATLIPAKGDDLFGGDYFITDTIEPGQTYWYRLESVSNNNRSDYYDPTLIVVYGTTPTPSHTPLPGVLATKSQTPTRTPTPPMTATGTQNTPSTGTSTATLTRTPLPPATSTATLTRIMVTTATPFSASFPSLTIPAPGEPSVSPEVLGTPTPAPTYKPIPTVSWEFPKTETPSNLYAVQWSPEQPGLEKSSLSLRLTRLLRYWPVVGLVFLWLMIGIWFIKSQQSQ